MTTEDASVLLREDDDGVCILTLNRPAALNSFNGELVTALEEQFRAIHVDDSVRVVVLTGAGDRAFCVGADLKERKGMEEWEVRQRLVDYRTAFARIEGLSKPVICAINGFAFGGGLEIALACDVRLVAESAKVGLTELRLGIIPGAGGTQRLPRVVGLAKAKELIYTAKRLTAHEAVAIGLCTEAIADDGLLEAAIRMAREMAKAAPVALAQAKFALDAGMQTDIATGLDIESRCYAVTIPTDDRLEGLAAFAEKRDPKWKGR